MSDEPMREYVCPACGFDGFKMAKPTGTVKDFNILVGCPVCATNDGRVVWLQETTDPRTAA